MRIRSAALTACLLIGITSAPALADKTVTLEAEGCPSCRVTVGSVEQVEPFDENDPRWRSFGESYQLDRGRVVVSVPDWVDSFQVGVTTKGGVSGPNSVASVAWQYRGYGVGEVVTNRMSRRAKAARICAAPVDGDTLRFRVQRERGPKVVAIGGGTGLSTLLRGRSPAPAIGPPRLLIV